MYVPPRPDPAEDPLLPLRLAAMAALGFVAVAVLKPTMPPLMVALPIGLLAGQRGAFSAAKVFGGAGAFIAITWAMTALIVLTRDLPGVMLTLVFAIYCGAFAMIRRTGSQIGMLVLVAAALLSITGMKQPALIYMVRDDFTLAALVGGLAVPVLYLILPPATARVAVDPPGAGAVADSGSGPVLIRGLVMLGLSFWLYAVLPVQDMLLAISAIFVLVFPTRAQVFSEAWQRGLATFYGGAAALVVLGLLPWLGHFWALLWLNALAGLVFGWLMLYGRNPAMVYQFALSVTLALVAGALSTQDPGTAVMMRLVLTLAGAGGAAVLVAVLEGLFLRRAPVPLRP